MVTPRDCNKLVIFRKWQSLEERRAREAFTEEDIRNFAFLITLGEGIKLEKHVRQGK